MSIIFGPVLEVECSLDANISFEGEIGTEEPFEAALDVPEAHGVSTWEEIQNKPFERIGETLAVVDGTLDVNIHETTNDAGGLTTIIG